ncbi:hypothetical protein VTI74DRAFT_1306 [Chaetomium olivicolor]
MSSSCHHAFPEVLSVNVANKLLPKTMKYPARPLFEVSDKNGATLSQFDPWPQGFSFPCRRPCSRPPSRGRRACLADSTPGVIERISRQLASSALSSILPGLLAVTGEERRHESPNEHILCRDPLPLSSPDILRQSHRKPTAITLPSRISSCSLLYEV